jgi:hypothetical protein
VWNFDLQHGHVQKPEKNHMLCLETYTANVSFLRSPIAIVKNVEQ